MVYARPARRLGRGPRTLSRPPRPFFGDINIYHTVSIYIYNGLNIYEIICCVNHTPKF